MVPTAMEPVPVALASKPGCAAGAGAASAVGTRLQEAFAFFLAGALGSGVELLVIFWSSTTFSLSAASANVSRGAWKLATLRLPLALVEPSDAARFVRFTEFCVNCRFALRTFTGWVSDGTFSEAFCKAPLPLKFMALVFLMGPVAWISRLMLPVPLMPSTAVIP